MQTKITLLIIALACAGCTTATRTVTITPQPNGTNQVSQTTHVSTFLTTVQGFDDMVDANGVSHTIIANYAGDVQMMREVRGMANDLMSKAVLMANTNLIGNSNFLATLQPAK
jgi:ABC-type phosphate/phosphonate transport system substrate-binding protein